MEPPRELRTVIDRRTGTPLREELVVALVKYVPVGVEARRAYRD